MERRLAAILAADVVGYTRLMRADEVGTLQRLTALREGVLEPLIAEHTGRVVKLMGDGLLVEFASLVDAVGCAVAWQTAVDEHEAERPEDNRFCFRIGINLGDVIVEGEDIHGDGVNIAARLEGLAEPGGICLSGDAYRQVRGKVEADFEDLGEREVKNLAEPLRVYRIAIKGPSPAPTATVTRPLPLPDKPSIAVLPFDNMSGDPEQEYLADGISEDLITALSKVRWFFVIARNSTFTYKGQAVEVTQVARELGVRYVIEGSVRKAGNRVRISAQLIDATTGRHVWAERYDRDLADIFELQDEMTQTIVAAVEPELGAAERERALSKPPENLDAWETYQRGLWHLWNFTKDDNAKAPHLLRRAHELDPGFATAYAHEADSRYINVIMGWAEDPDQTLAAGMTAAKKALALDDKDAVAYFAAGRVHMMLGEHDASIGALETSLTLNPNFAQAYHGLGFALTLAGRIEDALDSLAKAERLSPRDPLLWAFTVVHALACILSHDYETAVHWARRAMQIPRATGYWPHAVLAAPLAQLGRIEQARAAVKAALEQKPDLSLSYLKKTLPTKHPGGLDPYLDGLRKAGLPE
ncbi:MAG: adenylate/guanylate cyclase domain-containing protein, partial [Proteobacteria bacterium]|nr:adenylate/guanylate cyclase domain-containing protein [Pseudomonadota bacterium]